MFTYNASLICSTIDLIVYFLFRTQSNNVNVKEIEMKLTICNFIIDNKTYTNLNLLNTVKKKIYIK